MQSTMSSPSTSFAAQLLVIFCLLTIGAAIRVDWNTNKGPIVPPTPRTTVAPKRPYREPAPVWEDQSDDVPNPNPYIYILPPPSRPRPAENNYATFDGRPWVPPTTAPVNNNNNNNNNKYNNQRLTVNAWQTTKPDGNQNSNNNNYNHYNNNNSHKVVNALGAKYVPNVGIKYLVVVTPNSVNALPSSGGSGSANGYYANVAGLPNDKLHGKYNAKTKKYKVYEKIKSPVQFNYFMPMFELELPAAQPYNNVFNQEALLNVQQLPLAELPMDFKTIDELQREQQQPQQQRQQQQHNYYQQQQKQQSQYQYEQPSTSTTTTTAATTTDSKHRSDGASTAKIATGGFKKYDQSKRS